MYTVIFLLVPETIEIARFSNSFSDGGFKNIISRSTRVRCLSSTAGALEKEQADSKENEESGGGNNPNPKLFSCPVEGCIRTYQRYTTLERHLDCEQCQLKQERETLYDKAKKIYTEKLLAGVSSPKHVETKSCPEVRKVSAFQKSRKPTLMNHLTKGRYLGIRWTPPSWRKKCILRRTSMAIVDLKLRSFCQQAKFRGTFPRHL